MRANILRRPLLADKRGSVVMLFALCAMALAVMTAIVVDSAVFHLEKRRLQTATDLASLMLVNSGDITDERALEIVQSQVGKIPGLAATVTRGHYAPDAAKQAHGRFEPGVTPFNAVRVNAELPTTGAMLGNLLPAKLAQKATSLAARRQTATLEVGSRLVRLEGGLSQALLDATLGYDGKLTVMDYKSLASAQVDAVTFLKALNVEANLNAVTFEEVLDAKITVGQLAEALAKTAASPSIAANIRKAQTSGKTAKFKLEDFLDVGSLGAQPLAALSNGGVPISVGDLLAGSAALSDGDHQVAVDLAAFIKTSAIANAVLDIGEKPRLLHYDAYASPLTNVATSQFKLAIGALGKAPASVLAVNLNMASASVKLDAISCAANGTASVTLKANTKAASAGIKAPLLPEINVALGTNEQKTLAFSAAEIAAQTWKPTRSGLGIQAGGLNVGQKLLLAPVDKLLIDLGLNIAEADVKVIDVECGAAGLVG